MKAYFLLLCFVLAGCGPRIDRTEDRVVKNSGQPDVPPLILGDVERVGGTAFVTMSVMPKRDSGNSYGSITFGSRDAGTERNRLILNTATGESRKVLPDEHFEVRQWIVLGDAPSQDNVYDVSSDQAKGQTPADSYAMVVRRPSSEKERPPTYDVLLGHFSTGRQQWVATKLNDVQSIWLTKEGRIAFIGAQGGKPIYRLYAPDDFRQLLERPLAF